MNDEQKLSQSINKLWVDYLDLCESYAEEIPLQTFGYAMIVNVSKMMFDLFPNEKLAIKTINRAVEDGLDWSNGDNNTNGNKRTARMD